MAGEVGPDMPPASCLLSFLFHISYSDRESERAIIGFSARVCFGEIEQFLVKMDKSSKDGTLKSLVSLFCQQDRMERSYRTTSRPNSHTSPCVSCSLI